MLSLTHLPPFQNEPATDFNDPAQRRAMEQALEKVKSQFGQHYPLIIGGQAIMLDDVVESINPAFPDQVVGRFSKATVEHANQAIEAAATAFETWQYTPAEERAQYLFDAAKLLRARKPEFNAWMVYEVGKSWAEADADTSETLDFLEYYGRQMLHLAQPQDLVPYQDEETELRYIPLGVGVIIPPWNFPGAIMAGMSSAAIVSGNSIVLKPASTSPAIAYQFYKIMEEVGLPPGVFNFIVGPGGKIGDALIDHPKTRFIGFTGSMEVGLRINERAAKVHPGQIWIKRTILEMGGKDAVVVDETADLDAAAKGIVVSAFGFQGQKCSAGSRAIIHEKVYDQVLPKILSEVDKLKVGDPSQPDVYMGPVVDQNAYNKIREYIEIGKGEGKLVYGGESHGPGYFIEPTIFADVAPDARIAQEEIFGPVLAVIKGRDWDDLMGIANGTVYGLTGAVYTQNEDHIRDAQARYHVGNLYFNRKCTGAMVGVHPFGGFNMSGTDSKAGGPDYLLLFTQAKSIARKPVHAPAPQQEAVGQGGR